MIQKYVILFLLGFTISCSTSNDEIEVSGEFTHQITSCNSDDNPEFNCTEFINFKDDSTVDVLIGGGDIIYRTNYQLNNNRIQVERTTSLNFDISFIIQNETTLRRIENDDIWLKSE